MKKTLAVVICLVLLLPMSATAAGITLSTGEDQSNDRSYYLNSLLIECFRRMGVDVNIEFMPHKRALEAATPEAREKEEKFLKEFFKGTWNTNLK